MKQSLSLCLLFLLLVRCAPGKDMPYVFGEERSITLQEIPYPDILGATMQLIAYDNLLFVNDYFGDSLIHVFNVDNGRIEKKLISKGNGPNEGITPLDMQLSGQQMYILSRPIYSLNHLNLAAVQTDSITLYNDLQLPPRSDCFVALGNSGFVFSGFWDKRYGYLNLANETEISEFGEYPDYWEEEKDLPSDVKAFFHQCRFAKHPTKPLFASCSGYVLEIYAADLVGNELPRLLFKKQLGKYSYAYTTEGLITARTKQGSDPSVHELACSSAYLYMVIPSKTNKEHMDIMVVDWNGQPVKLLKSDKKITCLTIDEKAGRGYCIIEDPEETLAFFELEE